MTEQNKQEQITLLQEDIGAMRKQLEDAQKHLDSLKNEPCNETWEPKKGKYWVAATGYVLMDTPVKESCEFGTEYPTEKQAIKARDAMKIHNRLLAYVSEFDEGWEPDWNRNQLDHCYIYYDYIYKKYKWSINTTCMDLGKVYMSKQCAEELVDKLNKGEVVL